MATAKQAAVTTLAPDHTNWREVVSQYEAPRFWRSMWELANSFVPFFVLWYMMYRLVDISYPLTVALGVVTAGFMMRVFIIFHDCGHGSFFASQRLNNFVGRIAGIITFTPYDNWRHEHAIHHATSADLDRRGTGDVWTMTVNEYRDSPWYKKIAYSVFRTPIVMLGIGPFFMFLISHRFANPTFGWREKFSVLMTNLAILGVVLWLWATIGIVNFLKIELPIMLFAGMAGVWMFFVQHNFDDGHWVRHPEWDYVESAIRGSSWYKLPKVVQWFTGNIGLHHIHHLSPRIPNYNLEACHNDNEMFREVQPITFARSLKSLFYRFWDEEQRKFVWYDALWRQTVRPLETVAEPASD